MNQHIVISKLAGGLGNQMFQYACGYAVAQKNNARLLLDNRFLNLRPELAKYTLREFELDVFQLTCEFAPSELSSRFDNQNRSLFQRLLSRLSGPPRGYFKESSKLFQPEIFSISDLIYLDGYWQNEKYFSEFRSSLLQHFQPRQNPNDLNAQLAHEIRSTESICVHVRRGDYVSNASANQMHGTCSPSYYEEAARQALKQLQTPLFFVFSDDIPWVQQNIQFPGETKYISHNKEKESHWDLYLMKQGQRHIIANSSFSWWGAWLCEREGQQVFAPSRWFQGIQNYDITPPSWILL